MTDMDCPSENATLSKCNQRLDTVVDGEGESLPTTTTIPKPMKKPVVSCMRKSSCSSSGNSGIHKTKKKKGNVQFVEFITVTDCLHFLDYSKKEFKGTWYTDKEMSKLHVDIRLVLEKANAGGNLAAHFALQQDDELCLRGLEYKTPMGCKRREQNKRVAWQAVEREQYRQWDQGFKDEVALSREYQMATQHCVQKAILLAQEDRQAVLSQIKYFEMDGLSVGSSFAEMSVGSSSSGTTSPSSLFAAAATAARMHHHPHAHSLATGGRRPIRSPQQGRVSRAA